MAELGRPVGIESLEQSLAIARGSGDRRGEANALGGLGNWYQNAGELRRAVAHFEEAANIAGEIGDLRTASAALANLGSSLRGVGAMQDALAALSGRRPSRRKSTMSLCA